MRLTLAALLFCTPALPAQDRARNTELHLAYVGDLATDRGVDFVRFLRGQFPRVDAIERADCTPEQLRSCDVVLLDWSQQDGVMQWIQKRGEPRHNPLGQLARWDRPTVLLGSAGLNLAADWGLPGSYG